MSPAPGERLPDRIARLTRAQLRLPERGLLTEGNRVSLLATGEEYFPRLLAAIDASRRMVHLETYLFEDDAIGREVTGRLAQAARRGVQVRIVIDGYGGGEHARRLARELQGEGAQVRIYRPERWWRMQRRLFRRLHRKIVVIDDTLAFVGGINIIAEPLDEPGPRLDFAVACEGPIVSAIALSCARLWWTLSLSRFGEPTVPFPRRLAAGAAGKPAAAGKVRAALLLRDNLLHRRTIERAYTEALAIARRDVLIANAYFIPGRRFRAALVDAARRGVRVRLLLQGRVEHVVQYYSQHALYGQLLAGGVEIYQYTRSYLHAKAAVIDEDWATVGSSNLDPYSLLLAREANVLVRDETFCGQLRARLERAIKEESTAFGPEDLSRRSLPVRLFDWVAYGITRGAIAIIARDRDY
ncbi:MAG TPA: cardiolipin synthase ClsB [Steroidobacteraceae bacterium]|nr:cardiolipin synthase ClsB [Steroidobacteraceae bacterium]